MAKRKYYDVLGVPEGASDDQVRSAYRRLARQYHPDLNPGNKQAEQKFKEINEAYEVLSDPEKRKAYDRFGEEGVRMHAGAGAGPGAGPGGGPGGFRYTWSGEGSPFDDVAFEAFGGGSGPTDASAIFEELFSRIGGAHGRRGRRVRPEALRGQDVETAITLPFDQAVRGAASTITVQRPGPDGSVHPERLEVRIPPGVRDGQRLRLRGRGGPGMGDGPAGDLYLLIHVLPHDYFRREGRDVYIDVPISLAEAALGATVEVPTVHGRTSVRIPPGTAGGARLRLKGQGIAEGSGGARGDQYCVIRIVPPKRLTPQQKKLLEELRTLDTDDPRAGVAWHRK
jgi:DnaJ-class molecular chaperone